MLTTDSSTIRRTRRSNVTREPFGKRRRLLDSLLDIRAPPHGSPACWGSVRCFMYGQHAAVSPWRKKKERAARVCTHDERRGKGPMLLNTGTTCSSSKTEGPALALVYKGHLRVSRRAAAAAGGKHTPLKGHTHRAQRSLRIR
ncbi:hypothetical protein ABL78_8484 [Leptomonas seymouri]|uniref:Uncharacterized protein n=1 Tax=Leptomonas seymouri TaxID=5684 RepID=A0A0N0P239_LEPSE|nr:hypothetical protein ABL78_8484 [Leptomonas seymouri]|eukprot:KPI82506.1 hypothetical protein ABL78_8484 [Leptomonas seymouri]